MTENRRCFLVDLTREKPPYPSGEKRRFWSMDLSPISTKKLKIHKILREKTAEIYEKGRVFLFTTVRGCSIMRV
jgi:hypothetical protein